MQIELWMVSYNNYKHVKKECTNLPEKILVLNKTRGLQLNSQSVSVNYYQPVIFSQSFSVSQFQFVSFGQLVSVCHCHSVGLIEIDLVSWRLMLSFN